MTTTPNEPISDPNVQPDEAPNPVAPGEDPGVAPDPDRTPDAEPAPA